MMPLIVKIPIFELKTVKTFWLVQTEALVCGQEEMSCYKVLLDLEA